MAQTPPAPRTRRRRKPLNLTAIKSVIVFVTGGFTALGSAITGLGAQVAFAPMLTWMLGLGAEKAQATALRYAAFASAAAVFGAYAAHQMSVSPTEPGLFTPEMTSAQFWPVGLLLGGLLIFLGATLGAILTARLAPKPHQVGRKRLFQTIGVGVAFFVIAQARLMAASGGAHHALWHGTPQMGWLALLVLGLMVGGLTQVMGLASGILMVPSLYFLGGYTAAQAASLSLLVVAMASVLPAWSYSRRGFMDAVYSLPAVLGGLFGGLVGGLMLSHLNGMAILTLFAIVAMFLCARELARMALEPPPAPVEDATRP